MKKVATCGCVWVKARKGFTQGWKWKCVQRCAEHTSHGSWATEKL